MSALAEVEAALERDFVHKLPVEAAAELELLPVEEAAAILARTALDGGYAVWERLSPAIAQRIAAELDDGTAAQVLGAIDPTRAAAIIKGCDDERRALLLAALEPASRELLSTIMSYAPDTAGAIMDPRVVYLRRTVTVGDAIERVRGVTRQPGKVGARRLFYLVDEAERLDGIVEVQDLILARPGDLLDFYARPTPAWADVDMSQEQVVELIDRQGLSSLPVVDASGRMVGVIRYDTLVAATRAEASADLQTIFGASADEGALSSPTFAIKKRLPWLQINLVTAFLAASVVGVFESTIAQYSALAVLLPVVAGQSGNTGAQALAVVIRALALREINLTHWRQVILKEFITGLVNGIAVAITTSLGVYVWSRSWGLSAIIGMSMVLSMVIAGSAGAIIPILLTKFRQDPAQSSSIVLTTVTDVAGFFSFLGIATLLLHTL